jgi:hypothetical protein
MAWSNFNRLLDENFDPKYETRFKNFQYPKHYLYIIEKSPSYMAKKRFNNLPAEFKNLVGTPNLKCKMTSFLLEKNFIVSKNCY